MGSGNRPVRYRIRPPVGDQVSSTHELHCGALIQVCEELMNYLIIG
jgi:hypothetical protein